jgi:uncharacterized membrane protein
MGPVEYFLVGFPGNKFKGEIIPALTELVENETIRVLDLIFVIKDENGDVDGFEIQDLPEEITGLSALTTQSVALLNDDDMQIAAEALPANSSAAFFVFEYLWAERLTTAIRDADGELLGNERIPAPVVEAAFAALADES